MGLQSSRQCQQVDLLSADDNADVRIQDLGPPEKIISGFNPEIYGGPLNVGDLQHSFTHAFADLLKCIRLRKHIFQDDACVQQASQIHAHSVYRRQACSSPATCI